MAGLASGVAAAARALVRTLPTAFVVEQQRTTLNDELQPGTSWVAPGTTLEGVLAVLSENERIAYGQQEHEVSHRLLTSNAPYAGAKPGDRLTGLGRTFYVQLVERHQGLTVYVLRESLGGA